MLNCSNLGSRNLKYGNLSSQNLKSRNLNCQSLELSEFELQEFELLNLNRRKPVFSEKNWHYSNFRNKEAKKCRSKVKPKKKIYKAY